MPAIVEFPKVVQDAVRNFSNLFSCEPQRRLKLLQEDSTTRYSDQGVITIDDVLIDHNGKFIKDVGWFWDHAESHNKIAHDYLFVNIRLHQRQALSAGVSPLQKT